MKMHRAIFWGLVCLVLCGGVVGGELPRLEKGVDAKGQSYSAQAKLVDLGEVYVSMAPEDLGDGLAVGVLDQPGAEAAVRALVADDKAGEYSNLDSLLIWKDGKLLFEMYNRRGRVDGPHYAMSITKTLTSVTLARAMKLGVLGMEDLDKAIVDFMPEIDRGKIAEGVDTITLRDALMMKSGLRFESKQFSNSLGAEYVKQAYFQKLFENTAAVTEASKEYKYAGTDPSMIMMVLDIKLGGRVQAFIEKEVAGKFGAIYCWDDQACGIPKCGAGSNFTSRSLVKIGAAVMAGGKYHGEQVLLADYIETVLAPKEKEGYYYYFHNRDKKVRGNTVKFISGIGAGGQYMAMFPELNVVAVATSHNVKQIGLPLDAILGHLLPLFVE